MAKYRHGHATKKTKTYRCWVYMLTRCNNPKATSYQRYGGRGIAVCERWTKFDNFLADMGEAPAGMSLDRIDNNGNYDPNNCRWATSSQQARNTRRAIMVTHNGETLCLKEWAERSGVGYKALYWRLKHGMPPDIALTPERIPPRILWNGKKNRIGLIRVTTELRDAFHYEQSHSDLENDDQPIHISTTLGTWRRLDYALTVINAEKK